jgi:hypothetical protein
MLAVVAVLMLLTVKACGGEEEKPPGQARPPANPAAVPPPAGEQGDRSPGTGQTSGPATPGADGVDGPGGVSGGGGDPSGPAGGPSGSGPSAGTADPAAGPSGQGGRGQSAGGPAPGGAQNQGQGRSLRRGGGPRDCSAADFQLLAEADARTYDSAAQPRLTLVVKNVGSRPCKIDVGRNAPALVVASGPDRVWSSLDCARDQGENLQLLQPGKSLLVLKMVWSRNRSGEGCRTDLPAAKPGTYVVSGDLTGLAPAKDIFDLR